MLAVEAILHDKSWTVNDWNQMYSDLPNRQLKVKVKKLYTCGITPKHVTSSEAHLRGLALDNTTTKKHRSGSETLSNLTGPGIES